MRFANVHLLHLCWLAPIIWLVLELFLKRKLKKISQFVSQGLLKEITQDFSISTIRRNNLLVTLGFVFLAIALARPQWGYKLEKVKQQGLDIILAVDVSKSMLTKDVRPNRLERTKLAIKDLLKNVNGDRLGLMAFAGEAFLMCPLTVDYAGFSMSVDDLDIDTIPLGGTNISRVIDEALKTFGGEQLRYKALILITDGEEMQGQALDAVKKAKELGVKIFTVGIGTKEGDLIQVQNEEGNREFLKDEAGNFIKSRLNEDLLGQIAYETGGAYVRSSGAEFGLDYLYKNELSHWAKRDFEERQEKRFNEQFQWPLAIGIILLLLTI